jgi:UDP-N-acetylglucosamine 2-epimerase (non-hydrolysing)
MSELLLQQLELPAPDRHLDIHGGTANQQIGALLPALEACWTADRPDKVVVVGDTTSTLAGALAANKLGLPVAHVEAGLRSGDRGMPEEINRILTDGLSAQLFVTEQAGLDNLAREGFAPDRVFFSGNCMLDVLVRFREKAAATRVLEQLRLKPRAYCLLTMHRPSNVDHPAGLEQVVRLIECAAQQTPVVFPVHPRTQLRLAQLGLQERLAQLPNLHLLPPQGYLEFLQLLEHAALVCTDSGGVQEETTFLQVPCLTFRQTTERPATVLLGTNVLLPSLDAEEAATCLATAVRGDWKKGSIPLLWDGKAGDRIAAVLVQR